MTKAKDELYARVRNNHKHHPPKTEQRVLAHKTVRQVTAGCASTLIDLCPVSRELSMALTKMEEAMFWANAALAREANDETEDKSR